MHLIAADMVSLGVRAHVQRFSAGDVLTFDGRWWHATNYTAPVLNMCVSRSCSNDCNCGNTLCRFLTSGKDGEVKSVLDCLFPLFN
jgi:hypothetical protein